MHHTGGTVMPLIISQAPGFLSGLHLFEERGMIACFAPEHRVATVIMQRLDVGSIGAQTVFGDDELEMRVVLTQLDQEAFGGIPFTIIFVRAILLHNRFGHQWNHFTLVRMDNRGAQHLVIIRDRPVSVDLVQTRRTVNRLGGNIACAIEGQ